LANKRFSGFKFARVRGLGKKKMMMRRGVDVDVAIVGIRELAVRAKMKNRPNPAFCRSFFPWGRNDTIPF
jgi:hypothetical protein